MRIASTPDDIGRKTSLVQWTMSREQPHSGARQKVVPLSYSLGSEECVDQLPTYECNLDFQDGISRDTPRGTLFFNKSGSLEPIRVTDALITLTIIGQLIFTSNIG